MSDFFPPAHLSNTILVVEDSETTLLLICEELRENGHTVHGVATGGQALEWLAGNTPRLLLLDYQLPDMTARQLVEKLSGEDRLPPFIAFTGQGDERVAVEMMKSGARDYLIKDDFFLEMLPEVVSQVLDNLDNERSLQKARTELAAQQANLRALLESSAGVTGSEFFARAVSALNAWLGCDWALIGRLSGDRKRIRVEAMEQDGRVSRGGTYSLAKTPCEDVAKRDFCFYPNEVSNLFPQDDELVRMGARGYVGIPILDRNGNPIGILACVSRQPLVLPEQAREILETMAGRAAAELERLKADAALKASEHRFRSVFEQSRVGMTAVSPDGRFLKVNRAFCELLGYSERELLALKVADVTYPGDADLSIAGPGISDGRAVEKRYLDKQGRVIWGLLSVSWIFDESGKPLYSIGQVQDISTRKQQEELLHHLVRGISAETGENFFRSLVSHLTTALGADIALVAECIPEKPGWARTVSFFADGQETENLEYELAGTPCGSLLNTEPYQGGEASLACSFPDKVQQAFPEDEMLRELGIASYVGAALRSSSGEALGVMVVLYKTPLETPEVAENLLEAFASRAAAELERQKEQRRLEESEERFRVAFQNNPDPASLERLSDRTITDVNDGFCLILGYERQEVVGKDAATLNLWESAEERADFFRALEAEGEALNREVRILSRDGKVRTLLLSGRVVHFGGEPHVHIVGRDISRMKVAETALRASERRYHDLYRQFHALLNAISNPICLLSPDLNLIWSNEAAASLAQLPAESLVERPFKEILKVPDTVFLDCPARKSLESGGEEAGQFTDDALRSWEVRTFPVLAPDEKAEGVIAMLQDVTEKINLQKKNMRAGALASLGELAAGVAHEINNPVTGIIGYAEILSKRQSQGSFEEEIATGIIDEGERIAKIVRNLLSFARQKEGEGKSPVEFAEILDATLSLSEARLQKYGICLTVELEKGLPVVMAHKQQIEQVLLNLLSNACYALNLKYQRGDENKRLLVRAEALPVGQRVRVTVEDRGVGIPADILPQVCDPFFSTKLPDEGTGLGLSISHGIVAEHGGNLKLESCEGEYTRAFFELASVEDE